MTCVGPAVVGVGVGGAHVGLGAAVAGAAGAAVDVGVVDGAEGGVQTLQPTRKRFSCRCCRFPHSWHTSWGLITYCCH